MAKFIGPPPISAGNDAKQWRLRAMESPEGCSDIRLSEVW